MELILIRHGTTPGNECRRYVGTEDQPLSQSGAQLARSRREAMPAVDALWVSPMLRCRQTAELLFPDMEQHQVPQLRECNFGDFEGKTWEELKDNPLYQAWMGGDRTITLPGGESMPGFFARCRQGVEEVVAQAKAMGISRGAVVAHGGVWMAAMEGFGRPEKDFYQWLLPNCGGYRVRVEEAPLALTLLETI